MSQNNHFTLHTHNWKMEPILSLADHFHYLKVEEGQQKRLSEYQLDDAEELTEFNRIVRDDKITRIEMHMALEGAVNLNAFTSCMYMLVYHGESDPTNFKLNPFEKPNPEIHLPNTAIVPPIFKEMIATNWDEVDNHLIDDLFIAKNQNVLERVHYFLIGDAMTTFIDKMLEDCSHNILDVKIYAGLDLNKFPNKETISFTPVLGFKLPKETINSYRASGSANCLRGEVLLEYSMPCPPTCYPRSRN